MAVVQRIVTKVDRSSIVSRVAGSIDRPAFVCLHGWPQSSRAFDSIMRDLSDEFFVLAIDLPGVSGSRGAPPTGEKKQLARIVREVIQKVGAHSIILFGTDVGGMIAFSYLRQFTGELDGAIIGHTVIPGLAPWEKVLANPRIWHFAFHSVPSIPETIVAGHQRAYFDYFYDALAHDKAALTQELRDAYASDYQSQDALRAGFNWYRAMAEDAKQNQVRVEVSTPVLYLRGDHESGDVNEYVHGLRSSGLANVSHRVLPECGHFSAEEAPDALAQALRDFRMQCSAGRVTPIRVVGER